MQHARLPYPSPTSRAYSNSQSIESVMPSNHLILCRPLLLLPSILRNVRVFSSESALRIRWQITEGYLDTLRLSWWSRSLLSAASAVSLERDGRAPARGPLSRARWTEPHLLALFGFRSWYRPPRGSHSTAQRRSFQIAPSCWCRDAGHQGQENDQRRTI